MSDELLSQEEIEALVAAASEQSDDVRAGTAEVAAETQPAPTIEVVEQAEPMRPASRRSPKIDPMSQPVVRAVEFSPIDAGPVTGLKNGVDLILDVQLQVSVELGRTSMRVKEVLGLGPGSVVELEKHAGEPVEVVVNNKTVARGEVVVIDENFGVRITEIISGRRSTDVQSKAA